MQKQETNNISQYKAVFNIISSKKDHIVKNDILSIFKESGIEIKDIRIKDIITNLDQILDNSKIDLEKFINIVDTNFTILKKAVNKELIIPNFTKFGDEIEKIYHQVKKNTGGHNATYIPQLAKVNPNLFSVVFCSIDGQIYSIGDSKENFCVQSTGKPISYCIALEERGQDKVHSHVGREPSGVKFNEITLNSKNLPHNPMINAGAIITCSLIKPELNLADRFKHISKIWNQLIGDDETSFDNAVYHSEKETADRNFALAHFMKEVGAFPDNVNINDVLDFYFQCCSIQLTAKKMARISSTLANGGTCPLTNQKIFCANTVKNCLSMMYSCGMYDFSGEYAFCVGIPAKSGVSGALMLVIPNVGGFAIFSPRLDEMHNSQRGIDFSRKLVEKFNFHNYDNMLNNSGKIDPRKN